MAPDPQILTGAPPAGSPKPGQQLPAGYSHLSTADTKEIAKMLTLEQRPDEMAKIFYDATVVPTSNPPVMDSKRQSSLILELSKLDNDDKPVYPGVLERMMPRLVGSFPAMANDVQLQLLTKADEKTKMAYLTVADPIRPGNPERNERTLTKGDLVKIAFPDKTESQQFEILKQVTPALRPPGNYRPTAPKMIEKDAVSFEIPDTKLSVVVDTVPVRVTAMNPQAGWEGKYFGRRDWELSASDRAQLETIRLGVLKEHPDIPERTYANGRVESLEMASYRTVNGQPLILSKQKIELELRNVLDNDPEFKAKVPGAYKIDFKNTYFEQKWVPTDEQNKTHNYRFQGADSKVPFRLFLENWNVSVIPLEVEKKAAAK